MVLEETLFGDFTTHSTSLNSVTAAAVCVSVCLCVGVKSLIYWL